MSTKNTSILLVSLIFLTIATSLVLLPVLPNEIASHWNTAGEVDDYMPKTIGTLLFPAILLVLYILYAVIPKIDPLKANIESFRKYYNLLWIIISAFLVYIFAISMIWNLGVKLNINILITPGLAVLFYTIGIMLGKTKRNWFVGIRTPWTLSSDTVWEKTHKLGAKLFKLSAIIILISMLFDAKLMIWFILIPIIVATIVTVIYSYLAHRQEIR